MKIVSLTAENVKRLSAVEIKPDGSLVIVGGKNGAGKSSVLDSIAYALGGKSLCPSEPIRRGATTASVTVDLGEMIVERTFTGKHSYLTVKNGNGFKAGSPQKVLDKLVGTLSFDPLVFAQMEPRKQLETLKDLIGLDFTELDEERKEVYDVRTEHGRDLKRLEGQLAGFPEVDAPGEEVSVSDLLAELDAAQAEQDKAKELWRNVENAEGVVQNRECDLQVHREELKEAKAAVARLEKMVEADKAACVKAKELAIEARESADAYEPTDAEPIRDKIASAEEQNEAYRKMQQRKALAEEIAGFHANAEEDTAKIEEIDAQKREQLAGAAFPVEGLSLGAEGVLFNGLPFEQASSAEQLRVSVAMGLAMNPELKVILIRDGSLLDDDNLKLVADMAEAADAQVWLERVGEGDECSVIIEDGAVKEAVTADA